MVPGGEGENITEMNKVRYLDLWLRHKLESEIDESTRWFVEGLTNVVPAGVLDMFDANELKRLLSGDALDDDALDDLFQHVKYHAPGGEPGRNELRTLFETSMAEFEPKQRQAVFHFVTSLDRVPPGGCGSLSPSFTVEIDTQSRATTDRLPCASTCMNHVLMPKYPDVKTMMDRLRVAGSDGLEYHYEEGGGVRCEECDKTYTSGYFVRPSDDCDHNRCAPCMLERLQLCIKKKSGFDDHNSNLCKLCKDGIPCHNIPSPRTNGGVRCHWQKDGKTCPARIGRDRLEILKRVTELLAQRFPNQPPLTKPLTNEDMDKYDRLSVEGLIPAHRRVLCVNES
jgi:hypothetical protein